MSSLNGICQKKGVHESNTLGEFERKLLAKIRPDEKQAFEICDTRSVRCLTQLRVRFTPLNEHKFRHNFESVSPICRCNTGIEDNKHFPCIAPCMIRYTTISLISFQKSQDLSLIILTLRPYVNYSFFGNPRFNNIANKLILEATISFILSNGRLE